MPKPRYGKNQLQIIDAMRQGVPLYRFFENWTPSYVLEGIGEMPRDTVERLLARHVLVEAADAMFGVGFTYRLQEESHE